MTNQLFTHFGYCSMDSFLCSFIKPAFTPLLLPLAAFGASINLYFGISAFCLIVLAILLTLELISGLLASYVESTCKKKTGRKSKNQKWFSDRKLLGWGLKSFVLFFTLFVLAVFKNEYLSANQEIEANVFRYLHSLVVMYMVGVYLASVMKNFGRVAGNLKEYNGLIKGIQDFTKFPGEGRHHNYDNPDIPTPGEV